MSNKNKKIMDSLRNLMSSCLFYQKHPSAKDYTSINLLKVGKDKFLNIRYVNEYMNQAINTIQQSKKFNGRFSEKGLNKFIIDEIPHLLYKFSTKKDDQEVIIDKMSMNLFNYLCHIEPKSFLCIVPISGIIVEKTIRTKFINIHPYEDRNKILKNNKFKKIDFSQLVIEGLKEKCPFLVMTVTATNSESAEIKGLELANSYVNTLRTAGLMFGCNFNINLGFNQKKFLNDTLFISCSKKNVEGIGSTIYGSDLHMPFDYLIEKDSFLFIIIEKMQLIFEKIAKMKSINLFEQCMFTANNLIGNAVHSDIRSDKVVKFMSAIESFLETKPNKDTDDDITTQVVSRTSSLLYKPNSENWNKCHSIMKDLYDIRSKTSHGDNAYISQLDVNNIQLFSYMVFSFMINNFDEYDVEDFKNKLFKYIDNKINRNPTKK